MSTDAAYRIPPANFQADDRSQYFLCEVLTISNQKEREPHDSVTQPIFCGAGRRDGAGPIKRGGERAVPEFGDSRRIEGSARGCNGPAVTDRRTTATHGATAAAD